MYWHYHGNIREQVFKKSWGCRPNSNYLLTQSQVRYMAICLNLPIQKALACTELHSCKGTQTRTDCAIISFFPLHIRSCTKQSCYSYLAMHIVCFLFEDRNNQKVLTHTHAHMHTQTHTHTHTHTHHTTHTHTLTHTHTAQRDTVAGVW